MNKPEAKIIVFFFSCILMHYLASLFPNFFGDWLCAGDCTYFYEKHEPTTHWGVGHWLLVVMQGCVGFYKFIEYVEKKGIM
jgi:hypothetical protein